MSQKINVSSTSGGKQIHLSVTLSVVLPPSSMPFCPYFILPHVVFWDCQNFDASYYYHEILPVMLISLEMEHNIQRGGNRNNFKQAGETEWKRGNKMEDTKEATKFWQY